MKLLRSAKPGSDEVSRKPLLQPCGSWPLIPARSHVNLRSALTPWGNQFEIRVSGLCGLRPDPRIRARPCGVIPHWRASTLKQTKEKCAKGIDITWSSPVPWCMIFPRSTTERCRLLSNRSVDPFFLRLCFASLFSAVLQLRLVLLLSSLLG